MGSNVNASVRGSQGYGTGEPYISARGIPTLMSHLGTESVQLLLHGRRVNLSRGQILIIAELRKQQQCCKRLE